MTISEPLQQSLFNEIAEELMYLQGDFPVNHIHLPVSVKLVTTNVTCGPNTEESFASLNQNGLWLKTLSDCYLVNLDGSLREYSETWPKSGTMRNGKCYPQPRLALPTLEKELLWLPTPAKRDFHDLSSSGKAYASQRVRHQPSLVTESYLAEIGGQNMAEIFTWSMGFPVDWFVKL